MNKKVREVAEKGREEVLSLSKDQETVLVSRFD
jgi:hypothetical protein